MGLAVYVESGRYVVTHPHGDILVGLYNHALPIRVNGLLSQGGVVRMNNSGSSLFLQNDETNLPIAIGFHGDAIGATVIHSTGLIEVDDVEQRLAGLLLFKYSGPINFIEMLDQFTRNSN